MDTPHSHLQTYLGIHLHPSEPLCTVPLVRTTSGAAPHGSRNQHLLDIEAIEPVPVDQEWNGFYSILFLLPKSLGGWRGILNLKQLNLHVLYRRFKMHSLRSILGCIQQGDLMQSVDLKEAYLHVPIHLAHRQFLRFAYVGRHFQYRAMPFGFSLALRTFTKILAALAASVREVPVCMVCYLDDILILSSSMTQAERDRGTVIHSLQSHGFTPGWI